MTRILTTEWAWSQVEAMADGSLSGEDRKRMRRLMKSDPHLEAAVNRARAVREVMQRGRKAPVPAGLRRRLLGIVPGPAGGLRWAAIPAGAAGAVMAALIVASLMQPSPPPVDTRSAAVQEFQTAMSYLSKSAVVTSHGVSRGLSHGIGEALSMSRSAVIDEKPDSETGG